MSCILFLYFNGPRTRWSGKLCPDETLLCQPMRWVWLARWRGQNLAAQFESGKVGWAITDPSGNLIEGSFRADDPEASA